ncbi:MAG: hypothetical protein ACP5XB_28775 [Isosphaeraceae bacterium]
MKANGSIKSASLAILSVAIAVVAAVPALVRGQPPAMPAPLPEPRPRTGTAAPAPPAALQLAPNSELRLRVVPPPAPTYAFSLGNRQACVTPSARRQARADGGLIDVVTPASGGLTVTMTGTTAANSYLCCTGRAAESFQLVQDFEITSSDPRIRSVVLTLSTTLVGFVRSKGQAGAAVRSASVHVFPANGAASPLAQSYPCFSVSGTRGRLCNLQSSPIEGPPMALGRYTFVAELVLESQASGVCDAHAVADFSPDTVLPADWVRTRDPFQTVSKKPFGFTITLTPSAPPAH